jgi:hypothetical protein
MLPNLSRKAENELDTRLTPRVINRFRLRALHDCKIRCRLQESLPLAPTTERLRFSCSEIVFSFRPRVDVLLSRDKYVHSARPSDNASDVLSTEPSRVSVSLHQGGWEVRWRDATGRRRARRFPSEEAARAFDAAIAEVSPAFRRADTARYGRNGGVYSYATASGTRWRFVYRRTNGTQTTKRGFASERAARTHVGD